MIKQEGKAYAEFIPKDWNVIMADSADFNNDLFMDYSLVLEADKDYLNTNGFNTKFNGAPRILVILFGKGNDSCRLDIRADSLILRANGPEGDPLSQGSGIHTDGNIFEINYAGGATVQWVSKYRFAYRNKEWTLSTVKTTENNTAEEDAPLKVMEVDCAKKILKQDKNKIPLPALPKLDMRKFKPRSIEIAPGVVI